MAERALAITISLDPRPPKVHPPQDVFVDLNISGLQPDNDYQLLAAVDLTVKYNPNVLSFLTFASSAGVALGDPVRPHQVDKEPSSSWISPHRGSYVFLKCLYFRRQN